MTNLEIVNPKRITIEEAYERLDQALVSFLKTVPPSVLPYTGHLAGALGKNLRAKALILAALGDDLLVDAACIDLAVAIEMFHLATLVHDDIIDDAALRRGQKSLQAAFGKKTAVLCGDYLLAKALELSAKALGQIPGNRKNESFSLPMYASLVCLGEIRQHSNNFNLDLSIRRYLSIIRGKTAALFEAALAGGELFISEPDRISAENSERYKKIGRYMGMIFQMMDDLIDIEKSEEEAKKPILSDLKAGVITMPLIFAMETDASIKEDVLLQIGNGGIEPAAIQKKVMAAGGIEKTRLFAQNYYSNARDEISALQLTDYKKAGLMRLLDKAAGIHG